MYCKYCGAELQEGDRYCPGCGRKIGEEAGIKKIYSHEWTKLKVPEVRKSPGGAAAIGFFLGWIFLGPLGYVYLKQWNWFWITFVIEIFAIPLTLGIAWVVLPVVFAVHQYQMAIDLNKLLDQRRAEGNETGEGEAEGVIEG